MVSRSLLFGMELRLRAGGTVAQLGAGRPRRPEPRPACSRVYQVSQCRSRGWLAFDSRSQGEATEVLTGTSGDPDRKTACRTEDVGPPEVAAPELGCQKCVRGADGGLAIIPSVEFLPPGLVTLGPLPPDRCTVDDGVG